AGGRFEQVLRACEIAGGFRPGGLLEERDEVTVTADALDLALVQRQYGKGQRRGDKREHGQRPAAAAGPAAYAAAPGRTGGGPGLIIGHRLEVGCELARGCIAV